MQSYRERQGKVQIKARKVQRKARKGTEKDKKRYRERQGKVQRNIERKVKLTESSVRLANMHVFLLSE